MEAGENPARSRHCKEGAGFRCHCESEKVKPVKKSKPGDMLESMNLRCRSSAAGYEHAEKTDCTILMGWCGFFVGEK